MLFHQVTQKLRNMNYVISNENQVAINTMVLFSTLYLQLDLKWDHLQIIPFLLLVLIICHSSYLYNVNKMDTVVYESLKTSGPTNKNHNHGSNLLPRSKGGKLYIAARTRCIRHRSNDRLNSEKFQNFGFLTEIVIFESKSQKNDYQGDSLIFKNSPYI